MSKKKTPFKKSYIDVIITEELEQLGYNINWFRRASECLEKDKLSYDDRDRLISEIDKVYQYLLDKILDSLCNCADLKVEALALKAIGNSQQIRRGIRKRKEVK